MIAIDPHLLVRGAAVYLAVVLTIGAWAWRRPDARSLAGAMLGFAWNLPVLLVLNIAAIELDWWRFDAAGGLLLGVPVDLYLSWAWLWGAVPLIAFPSAPLAIVVLIALLVDLAAMPAAAPVLQLGPAWLAGEVLALVVSLVPGLLLARWTGRDVRLTERALLQVMAFSGLVAVLLPAIAIDGSGSSWRSPLDRPAWQLALLAQLLALPGIAGLSAVQEFVTRGGGTPVPFDPPKRIVTTGLYSYIRNPMQLSAVALLILLGLMLENVWVAAAGVMAHLYSAGLAGWDEDEDLRRRFGDAWSIYRLGVRSWVPRARPWHRPDLPPARLFVAESCGMCSEVGAWFAHRGATHLAIVAAESHPSAALTRITYEPADGSRAVSGVEAVARALEHVHFGWAFTAALLRLPIVLPCVQLLVDASGGEPRRVGAPQLPNR